MVTFVTGKFTQLLGRAIQAHFAFPDLRVQCKVFFAKFIAVLAFRPATKAFGHFAILRDNGRCRGLGLTVPPLGSPLRASQPNPKPTFDAIAAMLLIATDYSQAVYHLYEGHRAAFVPVYL